MKIIFSILFLLGLSHQITAQDKNNTNFRVGIFSTLDKIIDADSDAVLNYTKSGYLVDESKKNFSIGVVSEYVFTNNFALISAINYANKNLIGPQYCASCDPGPNARRFGEVKLQFIELPLSLRYYFLPKKFKIYANIGIKSAFEFSDDLVDNKHYFSSKLGGGIEYNLNANLAVQTITEYHGGFNNNFIGIDYKINSFSFGITLLKKLK